MEVKSEHGLGLLPVLHVPGTHGYQFISLVRPTLVERLGGYILRAVLSRFRGQYMYPRSDKFSTHILWVVYRVKGHISKEKFLR